MFHFIGYIPFEGRLYELDGLKEGPIDHGAITGDNWLETATPIIEKRMQRYSEGEIHFNLMAIVSDKKMLYERQIAELSETMMDASEKESQIARLRMLIEDEVVKNKRYKVIILYCCQRIRVTHDFYAFRLCRWKMFEGNTITFHLLWNCLKC